MNRPTRIELHLAMAYLWAKRSTCKRRKVGALITSADMTDVLAFGYNGCAQGLGNDACTGKEGICGCIHAEINALIKVDGRIPNKILFCTTAPCPNCASAISQANIKKVYYLEPYRTEDGWQILDKCGVEYECVKIELLSELIKIKREVNITNIKI